MSKDVKNYVVRNGSGYIDSPADHIIKKEYDEVARKKEDYKYKKMMNSIKKLIEDNSYILDGPISLINSENGRKKRIY